MICVFWFCGFVWFWVGCFDCLWILIVVGYSTPRAILIVFALLFLVGICVLLRLLLLLFLCFVL